MLNHSKASILWSVLAILGIIALSFHGRAPQFDPRLNSDQAIHVLMAYDLQLPDDLYYWGQDRLGSLLPILSHFGLKLISVSPVEMVGFVNYGLLLIAYCCFASFLSRPILWVLLAGVFFFPLGLYREILRIGQPYASQFACLGLATVGLRWLLEHWPTAPRWQCRIGLGLTIIAMIASLWVSTFSIIYLAVVLGAIAHYLFRLLPTEQRHLNYRWSGGDSVILGICSITGIVFLQVAKASAAASENYTQVSQVSEIIDLIRRMGQSIVRNLQFQGKDSWISIAAYCLVAIASYVIYIVWQHRRSILEYSDPKLRLWLGSWGLAAGVSVGILLISGWVYNPDELPQRYFIVVYVLCWISTLLLVEFIPTQPGTVLCMLLVGLAIASAMTSPKRVFFLKKRPPLVHQLAALEPLAPAGFVGNYWESYILCSANPERFHCTSYDPKGEVGCPQGHGKPYKREAFVGSVVRCERCVNNVLNSPTIYLVKNRWLDEFPERIEQFGYCLKRTAKSFKVAKRRVAPYQRLD